MIPNDVKYKVYKGLQKPLIFKGLKGKFIYIGGACAIGSLFLCALVSFLTSFLYGGMTLLTVLFGGLFLISQKQKKGLHNKRRSNGVFIVTNIYNKN